MGSSDARIAVWDPLVRVGHWVLVACVAAAWFTRTGGHDWHERFGYGALAIVLLRVLWGFIGPRDARFSGFVRSPGSTLGYAKLVLAAREPRYVGHNPLGGWMIVVLLIILAAVGLSGWLSTTDTYWGVKWVADLHEALSDMLLGLIALHLAGVAVASYRHRENLVAAMVHGRKRPEER